MLTNLKLYPEREFSLVFFIGHSSIKIRREIFNKVLSFPERQIQLIHKFLESVSAFLNSCHFLIVNMELNFKAFKHI